MASLVFVIIPLVLLVGCSLEGDRGPVSSSLSTPANATAGSLSDLSPRSVEVNASPPEPNAAAIDNLASAILPDSLYADDPPPRSESSEDDLMTIVTSTPTGVTVRLYWPRSPEGSIFGYSVYYGKEPAQEEGSCSSYEAHQVVEAPPVTITGLEPDTIYYFVVKQFNESDKSCLNEIIVPTPPAETEQVERATESPVHQAGLPLKG